MTVLQEDLNKLPKLIVGFMIMSFGIVLNKTSLLGLSSWNLFHDGLAVQTGISFGVLIQIVGLIILLFSVLAFKTKIGFGTLLNVLLVGFFIDKLTKFFVFVPNTILEQSLLLGAGILLMTFGRAFYISAKLGAGPRDGLFVGLSRITQVDVKYIKPSIELIVLVAGFIMGGTAGVGTIITIVVSGYLVQYFFRLLGFDPKKERQRSLMDYKQQKDAII